MMVLVLVFFSICTPYQIFKEAIANGVSRWTNWLAHHLMVITVLVVAWLMNALIELLKVAPSLGASSGPSSSRC